MLLIILYIYNIINQNENNKNNENNENNDIIQDNNNNFIFNDELFNKEEIKINLKFNK